MNNLYETPERTCVSEFRRPIAQHETIVIHPLSKPEAFNTGIENYSAPTTASCGMSCEGLSNLPGGVSQEKYYGSNRFLASWDMLEAFLGIKPFSSQSRNKIAQMVRDITVRYDLRELKRRQRRFAVELLHLFLFREADSVVVEIVHEGTPDGSDPAMQKIFEEISIVIARLIGFFGRRFAIRKLRGGLSFAPANEWVSLRSYWEPPTTSAIERWNHGQASFEECMQIHLQTWIRDGADTIVGLEGDKKAAAEPPDSWDGTVNCAMLEL